MKKSTEPKYAITTMLRGEVYTRLKRLRDTSTVTLQDVVFAGVKALEQEQSNKG